MRHYRAKTLAELRNDRGLQRRLLKLSEMREADLAMFRRADAFRADRAKARKEAK